MSQNLDKLGLKSIVNRYDLFFIDIWGVVHNGINLHQNSINVLENLSRKRKEFVLLTNAPRPNYVVVNFLKKMGLNNFFENVFTSGEASLNYLLNDLNNQKFFHIGPPRDFDLFKSFKRNKVLNINDADYLLCTGLFDDHDKDLNYYVNLLTKHTSKKMIGADPDLIVDRGDQREYCAGTIAKQFEYINGEVIYFGKPYPPAYNFSANTKNKKVLCIGDNLNTDIKGANIQNYDSLFITSGVHRQQISEKKLNDVIKEHKVKIDYYQSELKW